MKRILLLAMMCVVGVILHAQTVTLAVSSDNPLQSQIESLGACDHLIITGGLTAADLALLNSTTYSQLADVTTLDLSGATIEGFSTMADMSMSNLQYLNLPSTLTDVKEMKKLKSKNASLKTVLSCDASNTSIIKSYAYSFEANSLLNALSALGMIAPDSNFRMAKYVTMAGEYGDRDLHGSNEGANFTNAPAVWDFTGAHFVDCVVNSYPQISQYYAYDDQYETGQASTPSGSYATNAFYYFSKDNNYTNAVVDIKLPDVNMSQLPARSLYDLGKTNKSNYLLLHPEMTSEAFDAQFTVNDNGQIQPSGFAPLDLVIPNCYTLLDYECALEAHIKSLLIGNGNGNKLVVQGGAFRRCKQLEDLDFVAGINECWLGDEAFNECYSMKHIALAEGIVSLGAGCFCNSQHLESIRLPESLVYVGNACFDNCLALSSMTIPSNVEKIGKKAFRLCPITDFYLTTTDPDKIPEVWSLGTSYTSFDSNCTFYNSHLWGWQTINGVDAEDDRQLLATMTWDQATTWYYSMISGMAVLHYPEELAAKVRASISDTYSAESSDHVKLPMWQDVSKRDNIPGADLGSSGTGTWTKDGWAQFLLMKGYQPGEEDIVYTKEYSDVWYTMCFPFDLTDEQLAAAFNETFNIVDFSGVEYKDPSTHDVEKKTLILHFNKVAVTYYKDVYGNIYHRLCEGGTSQNDIYWGEKNQTLWREQHGTFSYNVYIDDEGNIYHHVHPKGGKLNTNKTKTFAISTEAGLGNPDNAVIIDGILAEAGHPYMIHPAIGVNPGQPKKACNLAGITWKVSPNEEQQSTDDYRDQLFLNKSRTVNLGHASTKDENRHNYYQADYSSFGYSNNEYTFIGNARAFKKGKENAAGDEPTFTETPPVKPVIPTEPPTEPDVEEMDEPTAPTNPATDPKYTDSFKTLFQTTRCTVTSWSTGTAVVTNYTYGDDLISYDFGDFFFNYDGYSYANRSVQHNENCNYAELEAYLGPASANDITTKFANLKTLAGEYANDLASYESSYAGYLTQYAAYQANHDLWEKYRTDSYNYSHSAEVQQEYEDKLAAYNGRKEAYESAHETWETNVAKYRVKIPQYAYFLGTAQGATYPKYWREKSNDQDRPGGNWTQYTAIIKPNQTAIDGIEADIDKANPSPNPNTAKSHEIAFNEPFFFIDDTPQGIATLIEKIEKEEGKAPNVEYMDIVVSIDGKIVSRDKTTFEGLPKGVYIINGKKYYVK